MTVWSASDSTRGWLLSQRIECGRGVDPGRWVWLGHQSDDTAFLHVFLKPVSNQTDQPDFGSDRNENQMVTREECEKQQKGEAERRKLFLWWLWKRRQCEENDSKEVEKSRGFALVASKLHDYKCCRNT